MRSDLEKFDINKNYPSPKKRKKRTDKKDNSKLFFLLFTLALIVGIVFYLFNYTKHFDSFKTLFKENNSSNQEPLKTIIQLNEVKYELGSKFKKDKELYISTDGNINEAKIDLSDVSLDNYSRTDKVGEYVYKVFYKNETFEGKIIVEDTTPPKVLLKTIYVGSGYDKLDVEMFLRRVIDNSNSYIATIVEPNKINTNTLGEKKIMISVKDIYDNETKIEAKLVVLEAKFKDVLKMGDLNISYNDKNDLNWDGTITYEFPSAIITSSSIYSEQIKKINQYDWSTKIREIDPEAIINKEDILILYNQHDLAVGIVKRVNLTIKADTKDYYLTY